MKKKPIHHSIETLESRIAPAGLVTTDYSSVTGVLTIIGDGDANSLVITKIAPASYRIEGIATDGALENEHIPTLIDGGEFRDIGKITSIKFAMGNGDDRVELQSLGSLKMINFEGGEGSDHFVAQNLKTSGDLYFIDSGGGNDRATLTGDIATIGNSITAIPGPGGSFELKLLATSNFVRKDISISGDTGNDGVVLGQLSALQVGGSIAIVGGNAGNDFLQLNTVRQVSIGKGVLFQGGGSDFDRMSISGSRVVVGQGIYFSGSNDPNAGDELYLGSHPLEGSAAWTSPADVLRIGRFPMSGNVYENSSITFEGYAGDDVLAIEGQSVVLPGGISFSGGDGNDQLISARSGKISIGHRVDDWIPTWRFSIDFDGGGGNDTVSIHSSRLEASGQFRIDAGGGNNTLELSSHVSSIGDGFTALAYSGGDGTDSVRITGDTMATRGYVDFSAYRGDNSVNVDVTNLRFGGTGGSLSFSGSGGDNIFEINSHSIVTKGSLFYHPDEMDGVSKFSIHSDSITAASIQVVSWNSKADEVEVAASKISLGRVEIRGDGNDSLTMVASGVIKGAYFDFGNVVEPGSNGHGEVNIRGFSPQPEALKFTGPTIFGGLFDYSDVTPDVPILTGNLESVTLSNVTFSRLSRINANEGNSVITLDNIRADQGFQIDTNGGNDVVEIERNIHVGPSAFAKFLKIDLGTGNDILRIGNSITTPEHRRARLENLFVNGGDGTDKVNADLLTGANIIVGTPDIQSVEEQNA